MRFQLSGEIRILIVDDQRMFREGIRARLEREPDIQIVGEAATAEEAIKLVQTTNPSTVLVDIRLPDASGIDLAKRLRKDWPDMKILVLTGYDFDQYVQAMARIGVDGYLLKDAPQDALVEAIRDIVAGGAALSPQIASKVLRGYSTVGSASLEHAVGDLTVRELDILELIHLGLTNPGIAEKLSISPRTVEAHVGNIMAKLGVPSRSEAVRIAVERRLFK